MSSLTPEQLQKRKKTNRRVFLFVLLPLIVIILLCVIVGKDKPETATDSAGNQQFIDSIVAAMKTDTTYVVKAVTFQDSTFNIAVTNPNPDVAGHFNIMYGLMISYSLDPLDANDALTRSRGITGIAIFKDTISKETVVKEFGSHFMHGGSN